MEQIVEKEKKSFFRILLVLLGLVFLVNGLIMILDKFTHKYPYLTTIISIFLVTIACGFLLIRYLSKISYLVIGDYLVFSRIIGKRQFEILRVGLDELFFIDKKSKDNDYKKPLFNFTVDDENIYVGKYKREGKKFSFLFSPNEEFLRELRKNIK